MSDCMHHEPSRRISFNDIVSRLLPSMSAEFHSVSYYCMSLCGADTETDDHQSAAQTSECPSVQLNNSVNDDRVALMTPSDTQQQQQPVDTLSDESDDSHADSHVHEQRQCTSVGSRQQQQQQQRPLAFCSAVDSPSITVNGGLSYHRLPAAC